MGDGKLIINVGDGMEAMLLEDLLLELKSGEHVIDTVEWERVDKHPTKMTINFKEGTSDHCVCRDPEPNKKKGKETMCGQCGKVIKEKGEVK